MNEEEKRDGAFYIQSKTHDDGDDDDDVLYRQQIASFTERTNERFIIP
jgi:hypothetical protein